jgi:ParB family chromosome partitioning protein
VPKKSLGRGLGALIPSLQQLERSQVIELEVELLVPNPFQPRLRFEDKSIEELAESIKKHGLIQPIIVRKKEGRYEIVAGERRWQAAKKAGLQRIHAVVKDVSDEECALMALVENLQRENLNPLEEAIAFKNIQDRFQLTQEEIADKIGLSRSTVTNTLRILNLPEPVKNLIRENKLSRGHAVAISGLPTEELQLKAAEAVVKNSLSVRETERLVNLLKGKRSSSSRRLKTGHLDLKEIEKKLALASGMKARIKLRKQGIEIIFKAESLEEVERLSEKLGG